MIPVAVAEGTPDPAGWIITSQDEAVVLSGFCGWFQFSVAVVALEVTVSPIGFEHVGAGAQVIFATQPASVTLLSEVNTKVKHPPGVDDVKAGGKVVPWYVPNKGAEALLPSYTLKWSQQLSVANEVKVTVTKFVGVSAQTYTVLFSLFW